jgi:hypothetical protein
MEFSWWVIGSTSEEPIAPNAALDAPGSLQDSLIAQFEE